MLEDSEFRVFYSVKFVKPDNRLLLINFNGLIGVDSTYSTWYVCPALHTRSRWLKDEGRGTLGWFRSTSMSHTKMTAKYYNTYRNFFCFGEAD